jgi:hypothetical protein
LEEGDRQALADAGFNPRQRPDGSWQIAFTSVPRTRTVQQPGVRGGALREALAAGLITPGTRPPSTLTVGDVGIGQWIHDVGRSGVSRLEEEDRQALADAGFNLSWSDSRKRWFLSTDPRVQNGAGGLAAAYDATVMERASSHGWQASPVPRDGDCLFTSLLAGRAPAGQPVLPAQVHQLREDTARHLETHADFYWANEIFQTHVGNAYMHLHRTAGTPEQVVRWAAALLRTPGNYANEVGDIAPLIAAGALDATLEILVINNDGSAHVQEINPSPQGQPPRPRHYLVHDASQLHWMPAQHHHP